MSARRRRICLHLSSPAHPFRERPQDRCYKEADEAQAEATMATRPTDTPSDADRWAIDGLVLSACKSVRRIEIADKGLLYTQGEPAIAVFLVLDGFAKVSHVAEDGT